IQGAGTANLDAGRALAARFRCRSELTVKASRKDPRGGGFADTADAGEEKGMGDPTAAQRRHRRARDVLLPDQLLEPLGAPFARKHEMGCGRCGHGSIISSSAAPMPVE